MSVLTIGRSCVGTSGESPVFKKDETYFELKAAGCVNVGLKAKLLIAKNLVDFKARGCLAGSGNYNFPKKELKTDFYIPPVVLNGEIHIETKGSINFELIKWGKNISVTDKVRILKEKFQF